MKKKAMFIFMLLITVCIMYVSAETGTQKESAGQPPLFANSNGYLPGGAMSSVPENGTAASSVLPEGFSAPTPPVQPNVPAVPVPSGPGRSAGPAPMDMNGPSFPVPSFTRARIIDITPDKIQQVLSTSKSAGKYLKSGKIWVLKAPGGELEIKGGVLYQGAVVAVINFSPVTGLVLPSGYGPPVYQEGIPLKTVRATFKKIVAAMKVLEGVWYNTQEGSWSVPLVYNGEIITSLKVYTDGIHIIPDYEASREMAYYGQ